MHKQAVETSFVQLGGVGMLRNVAAEPVFFYRFLLQAVFYR